MSPRAAWRLEQLGFTEVSDYAGGKMDWLAHGLPFEGDADLVGPHLRPVPTCRPDELVAAVAERVGAAAMCVVVTADDVVMGVLDEHALAHHGDARADEVATFGPTTVRPSEERSALEKRMHANHVPRLLVTDPTGRLLGVYEASVPA
jgi:CBS domain-containing protein